MNSSDDLLVQYRELSIKHGTYRLEDSRKANRAFDRLKKVTRALFEAGPERSHQILTLLDDDSLYVRQSAAFDALSIEPEQGLRVLREIASGPPSIEQFSAEQTLEMWHAGTLPLQWWSIT